MRPDLPAESVNPDRDGSIWVSSLSTYRDSKSAGGQQRRAAVDAQLAAAVGGTSPSGGGLRGASAWSSTSHAHVWHEHRQMTLLQQQTNRRYAKFLLWFASMAHLGLFIAAVGINGWTLASLTDNPLLGPGTAALSRIGATATGEIVYGHQYWRLLVSPFLSAGALHVWANVSTLMSLGLFLTYHFAWWQLACIYMLSGMAAVSVSANIAVGYVTAAGSAPTFGFMAAASVLLVVQRDRFKNHVVTWAFLAFMLALNCFIGATPFVDNSANTTGFVVGALMAAGILAADWVPSFVCGDFVATTASIGLIGLAMLILSLAIIGLNVGLPIQDCCDGWVCAPTPGWWECSASQVSGFPS